MKDKNFLHHIFLVCGLSLLFGITTILIVSSIIFFFHEQFGPLPLFSGIAVLSASVFLLYRRYIPGLSVIMPLVIIAALALLICVSFFVSGYFYDISWDGLAYHQEAIIQLVKNKWNPIYEDTKALQPYPSLWLDHYPKGPWILSSSLYNITNKIEYSKMFNLLFLLIPFFLVFSLLIQFEKINRIGAFFLSALASLNPVVLGQIFTFYIDGQLACMLTSLFASGVLYYRKPDRFILTGFCCAIIILVNIKFTGIAYAFVVFLGFWTGLCIFKKALLFKPLIYGLATAIIALLIVGFNPYVKSTIEHGNPLYPFFDDVEYDIMTENTAVLHVASNNRFVKFFKSISSSSETENYKIPFSISKRELRYFKLWDNRIEGFGPLFSGIFLISIIFIIINIVRMLLLDRVLLFQYIYILSVLLFSIFIIPECWWARYSPQLWLLPMVAIIGFIYSTGRPLYQWLLPVIVAANIILIGREVLIFNVSKTREIETCLSSLARFSRPVQLYWGDCRFRALRRRLEERNITYVEIKHRKDLTFPVKIKFECADVAVPEKK